MRLLRCLGHRMGPGDLGHIHSLGLRGDRLRGRRMRGRTHHVLGCCQPPLGFDGTRPGSWPTRRSCGRRLRRRGYVQCTAGRRRNRPLHRSGTRRRVLQQRSAATHPASTAVTDNFPTARSMLHQDAWLCLLVWCKACHHQVPADLQTTSAPASAYGPLGEKRRSGRRSEQLAAGLARFRYFRLSASVRSPSGGSWWAETAASRSTMPGEGLVPAAELSCNGVDSTVT
jgi:hypothetical protein